MAQIKWFINSSQDRPGARLSTIICSISDTCFLRRDEKCTLHICTCSWLYSTYNDYATSSISTVKVDISFQRRQNWLYKRQWRWTYCWYRFLEAREAYWHQTLPSHESYSWGWQDERLWGKENVETKEVLYGRADAWHSNATLWNWLGKAMDDTLLCGLLRFRSGNTRRIQSSKSQRASVHDIQMGVFINATLYSIMDWLKK